MTNIFRAAIIASALLASACGSEKATQTTTPPAATNAGSTTTEATPDVKADIRTKAVLVYADWCSSCKILDPKLKAIKQQNAFENVEFVTLDYTDRNAESFFAAAAQAGVADTLKQTFASEIKTGQLLLIDADNGAVISKVTKGFSESEIVTAISNAVVKSARNLNADTDDGYGS